MTVTHDLTGPCKAYGKRTQQTDSVGSSTKSFVDDRADRRTSMSTPATCRFCKAPGGSYTYSALGIVVVTLQARMNTPVIALGQDHK